ncbi:HlyD family secretion protein [Rhodanobacter ginsenosidimutans]|uniref:HlyD family secretion protein n=1 Tax=Rhodanobacter ginsenosidimutans TaxID=490571 RepID=A0ABW0K0A3_9GAMM
MILRFDSLVWSLALLPLPVSATVFSGEVQVTGAQEILTPSSMSSPVVLRYYVDDGARVKKGDDLLRIDAGPAETQLRTLQTQLEQVTVNNAKEVAELELKQADAELALADAQADRDTAAIDAVIPKSLISALDYDRYQGEMQRTDSVLALKKLQVTQAVEAVARRREDSELELRKLRLSLDFYQGQVTGAVVHATRDGTVTHGVDNLFGSVGRYEEGSLSYPGTEVGEVVGDGDRYTVRGWVLEPDRVGLRIGQPLQLHFDALPGSSVRGSIEAISGASTSKSEWGNGRYYEVEIALPDKFDLPLRQGMSVRADSDVDDVDAPAASPAVVSAETLEMDGEIYAQRSLAISPPVVDGMWQMTVAQMAGDGDMVKKGDMLVVFEGAEVLKNLTAKQGELAEKVRKREQLRLDLADRAREAELATAQAQAEMEKARRKADQPMDYIARVDYQKLVVARRKAEQRLSLIAHRQHVATLERVAEQRMADEEVVQLEGDVKQLNESFATLTVRAPRDGIVLHQNDWRGGKTDVGSQVWRGQSVAQMPELSTLAVRAALPERDLTHVRQGQRVSVILAGGGDRSLGGSIAEVGGTVHSKSRVAAVPVVDLVVKLDPGRFNLKPGQSVQVRIPVAK